MHVERGRKSGSPYYHQESGYASCGDESSYPKRNCQFKRSENGLHFPENSPFDYQTTNPKCFDIIINEYY